MAYFKCSSGKGKGGINTKAFLYSIDESQGGVWTNSHIDTTSLSKLIFTYSENSVDKYTAEFNVSDIVVYSGSGADVFTTVFPAAISTNAFNVRIYNDELWVSFSGIGDSFKAVSIYKDITQQLMGVTNIISGTDIPANSNGVDGQIYLRYTDDYINHIFMNGQIVVQEKPNDNTYLKLFVRGLTKTTSDIAITDNDLLSYLSDITNGYLKACDSYDTAESDTQTGIFAISNDNGSMFIRTYIIGWTQYKAGTFYGVIDLTESPVSASGAPEYQHNGNPLCVVGIFQTYLKVNGVWEELIGEDINNVIPDNALSYLIKEDTTPISGEGTDGQIYLKYGLPQGALLHFEESATADEFGNTWTSTGAVLSTDQAKFGTKSLYFNGSAILESDEGNANFQFGINDFTIACWIYPTSTSRQAVFAFNHDYRVACDIFYGQGSANMWLGSNGQWNEIQSDNTGSKTGQGTIALTANTWTHIAYTRKGNKCRMFVNGQLARESTITDGASVYWASDDAFRIGKWGNNGYQFSGYIDDFLILNGVCLYDSAFNVPTEPYDKSIFEQYVNGIYVKSQGEWVELMNREVSLVKNAQPSPTQIKNILKGTSEPPINKGASGDMYLKYIHIGDYYDFRDYLAVGSTAGPYIDTGLTSTRNTYCEIKFQYTDTPTNNTWFFGAFQSVGMILGYQNSRTEGYLATSGGSLVSYDTDYHIAEIKADGIYLDGVKKQTGAWAGVPLNIPIYLFSRGGDNPKINNCKIYYAKIWVGDVLTRHFVASQRKSDNAIGMIDLVEGKFYENKGTNSFTIGSTDIEIENKPIVKAYGKADGIWRDIVGIDVDDISFTDEQKPEIGINYLKLKINQTRGVPSDGCLQMDEFKIYQNGHLYNWNEEVSITSDMSAISGYEITKLIDGDVDTKFATLDWGSVQTNTCNIIIDLKETLILDANSTYTFITPNDEPTRDPVTWALYGSVDGVNWNRLDDRNGVDITTARKTETQEFYFNVLNGDVPEFLCDEGYFVETVSKTQGSSSIKIIKQSTDGTQVETTYTQSEAETEITIDDLFKFKFQQGSNWLFTVLKDCDGFKAGDQQGWNYNNDADFFIITKYSWSANCEWLYARYGSSNYTCQLSGRQYYKTYPHQTLIGYGYRNSSYTSPLYVSTYAKAAVFNTSDGGGPFNPNSFVYRGLTWYVCSSGYAMSGNVTDNNAKAIHIPEYATMVAGAKYIIDHCGLTVMKETESTDEIVLFDDGEFKNLDKATLDLTSDYQIEDGCIVFGPTTTVSGFTFATNTVNNKYVAYVVGENIGSYDFTIQYGVSTIGYSVDQVVGSGTGRISYETQSTTAGVPFIASIKQDSANTAQGIFIGNHSGSGLEYKIRKVSLILYS